MPSKQQQFIYTLHPNRLEMLSSGPTSVEASTIGEHVMYLERLAGQGSVLLAGRTQTSDENTFGIVILNTDSEASARAIMAEDPAVANGVMSSAIYPYSIAVVSPNILSAHSDDA